MTEANAEGRISKIQSKVSTALEKANEAVQLLGDASTALEDLYTDLSRPDIQIVKGKAGAGRETQ